PSSTTALYSPPHPTPPPKPDCSPSPISAKSNSTAAIGPLATLTLEATSPPNPSGTTPQPPTRSSHPSNSPLSSPQTLTTGPPSTRRCSPSRAVCNNPASPPASSPTCPAPWRRGSVRATLGSTNSPTTPGPTA